MKVQFPDVLCQTGQRPMTLIWTSWTLKMYLKTNLCATGMLINIVSRKDFSYSLVEIESKQCFNSSSQLAPIHPQLKLIHPQLKAKHLEHMVLKARYMIKSRACVRKFYISVFVLEILERRKVLKRGCSISWAEPVPRASAPCRGSSPPSPLLLPIFWFIFFPSYNIYFTAWLILFQRIICAAGFN